MKKIVLHRRDIVNGAPHEGGTEFSVGDPKKAGDGELVVSAAEAKALVGRAAAAEVKEAGKADEPEAPAAPPPAKPKAAKATK